MNTKLQTNDWHIAWDDGQMAGYSLCRYRNGIGWVGSFGVRRPWRKRGLAIALLLQSFVEFHKRGTKPLVSVSMRRIPLGQRACIKRSACTLPPNMQFMKRNCAPRART